jgi:hypothetical protein
MPKNNYIRFAFFILAFGFLGFYRDYFFANYNNVMYFMYNGDTTVPVKSDFNWLLSFSYKTVYYLKYIFTILFVLGFYGLSMWCLKLFTQNKSLLKWLTYSYLLLLILSSLLMLWSYFVKVKLDSDEYSVSRWMMGIAQSPLPLIFFLATSKLMNNETKPT